MSVPPPQGKINVLISDCMEKDMPGGKHGLLLEVTTSLSYTIPLVSQCDSHCESESPHPGMWEGELGSKGIPLM